MMTDCPTQEITGLVLAGGEGRRMGGLDKGLQLLGDEPLVARVLRRFAPQVGTLIISANRHLDDYRGHAAHVLTDRIAGHAGPLAGIDAGLHACRTPWLACVPCDAPFLPEDLVQRLYRAAIAARADLAYGVTGEGDDMRVHPVFALMRTQVAESLAQYLHRGGRKVREWQATLPSVAVPFSDPRAFANLNTMADLAATHPGSSA